MELSRLVFLVRGASVLLLALGLATAQQLPEAPSAQGSSQKPAPTKPAESSPPQTPAAQAAQQNPADQPAPVKPKPIIPASAERHYHQGVLYEREGDLGDAISEYRDAVKD